MCGNRRYRIIAHFESQSLFSRNRLSPLFWVPPKYSVHMLLQLASKRLPVMDWAKSVDQVNFYVFSRKHFARYRKVCGLFIFVQQVDESASPGNTAEMRQRHVQYCSTRAFPAHFRFSLFYKKPVKLFIVPTATMSQSASESVLYHAARRNLAAVLREQCGLD